MQEAIQSLENRPARVQEAIQSFENRPVRVQEAIQSLENRLAHVQEAIRKAGSHVPANHIDFSSKNIVTAATPIGYIAFRPCQIIIKRVLSAITEADRPL